MDVQAQKLHSKRRSFLLSPSADSHLNGRLRKHGDLSRLVLTAVEGVDLAKVRLDARPRARGTAKADLRPRQFVLPVAILGRLREQAINRGTSLNVLVDAAIRAYFSRATAAATDGDGP